MKIHILEDMQRNMLSKAILERKKRREERQRGRGTWRKSISKKINAMASQGDSFRRKNFMQDFGLFLNSSQ